MIYTRSGLEIININSRKAHIDLAITKQDTALICYNNTRTETKIQVVSCNKTRELKNDNIANRANIKKFEIYTNAVIMTEKKYDINY